MNNKKFKRVLSVFLALALSFSMLPVNSVKAQDADSVVCAKLDTPNALQNYIDNDGAYSSREGYDESKHYPVHKLSVNEPGWLFIRSYSPELLGGKCRLYSNSSLTSLIDQSDSNPAYYDGNLIACYVQKGNYYYQNDVYNYTNASVTNYVGFMPSSKRIKVKKITYSKDKSVANVSFDYDTKAFRGFSTDKFLVRKGDTLYTQLNDSSVWRTDLPNALALTKNNFKVTSNGTYTAKITFADNYNCMVTFKVTGIKNSRPAAPKITSYKKGSRTVKGTGKAYTKVYVTVKGKTYSANVSASGSWKITAKSALKKGQKISAYIKNTAGTKSATASRTVK